MFSALLLLSLTASPPHPGEVARPCNPNATAEGVWFEQASPGDVTLWFETEEEATSYQDPNGRSVYWLVKEGADSSGVAYVGGINDLWALRFDVLVREGCAVTVTGEH